MEAVCAVLQRTWHAIFCRCRAVRCRRILPWEKMNGIEGPRRWYYDFIACPRMWLRRRVYDYIHKDLAMEIAKPCTAIHVRPGDMIEQGSRGYLATSECLNASNDLANNIFLRTTPQLRLWRSCRVFSSYSIASRLCTDPAPLPMSTFCRATSWARIILQACGMSSAMTRIMPQQSTSQSRIDEFLLSTIELCDSALLFLHPWSDFWP